MLIEIVWVRSIAEIMTRYDETIEIAEFKVIKCTAQQYAELMESIINRMEIIRNAQSSEGSCEEDGLLSLVRMD